MKVIYVIVYKMKKRCTQVGNLTSGQLPEVNPGFTLIEMLVVIAILALLMGLVFPAINRSVIRAQGMRSSSNLRNLGTALMMYATENKGYFPPSASQVTLEDGGWASGGLGSWDSFILPYLFPNETINPGNVNSLYDIIRGSASMFSHPRDQGVVTLDRRVKRGYAMITGDDAVGVSTWTGNVFRYSANLSSIPSPSSTLLLAEQPGYENNHVGRTGLSGMSSPERQLMHQPDLNGKEGRFHYLFADGHVKFLDVHQTYGEGTLTRPEGMWTMDSYD